MLRRRMLAGATTALAVGAGGCTSLWRRGSFYTESAVPSTTLVSLFNKTASDRRVAVRLVDGDGTVLVDKEFGVPGSDGNSGLSVGEPGEDPGPGAYELTASMDGDRATRTWRTESGYDAPHVVVEDPKTLSILLF